MIYFVSTGAYIMVWALGIQFFLTTQNQKKIEKNIHWTAPEYMIHNTLVIQLYRDVLDNMGFQSHERIEKFAHFLKVSKFKAEAFLNGTYIPDPNILKHLSEELEVNADFHLLDVAFELKRTAAG